MQAVTLELVTPVPQGAHWLIRKQVHNLASQTASQHFYHRLRWAVDGRRLTAPLLRKQLGCTLHSGKHVQTGLSKQKGCEPLISCAREVHTHTPHTHTHTHTQHTHNTHTHTTHTQHTHTHNTHNTHTTHTHTHTHTHTPTHTHTHTPPTHTPPTHTHTHIAYRYT